MQEKRSPARIFKDSTVDAKKKEQIDSAAEDIKEQNLGIVEELEQDSVDKTVFCILKAVAQDDPLRVRAAVKLFKKHHSHPMDLYETMYKGGIFDRILSEYTGDEEMLKACLTSCYTDATLYLVDDNNKHNLMHKLVEYGQYNLIKKIVDFVAQVDANKPNIVLMHWPGRDSVGAMSMLAQYVAEARHQEARGEETLKYMFDLASQKPAFFKEALEEHNYATLRHCAVLTADDNDFMEPAAFLKRYLEDFPELKDTFIEFVKAHRSTKGVS